MASGLGSDMDERTISIIKEMHKGGTPYARIASLLKITKYAVRKVVDPDSIEREKERNRSRSKRNITAWIDKKQAWQDKIAEVPKDTRTYSQILMGEPLPGRSALDNHEPWKPKSIAIPIEKGAGE